jgi:hypothetical protein
LAQFPASSLVCNEQDGLPVSNVPKP